MNHGEVTGLKTIATGFGGTLREAIKDKDNTMKGEIMSDLLQVTDASFADDIEASTGTTLVDFWTPWCGPCRAMEAVLQQANAELDDVTIAQVNVDENPQTAMKFEVLSIPTFVLFKDGQMVKRLTGAMPKTTLIKEIQSV